MGFTTYFICTGNQARSVIAEHSFRRATKHLDVTVGSAGLYRPDAPALPEMTAAALAHDLDLSKHRSRNFATENLAAADLVLGFERQHVATVVVDGTADPATTFLLRELERLLEGAEVDMPDPIERARTAIATAHQARIGATAFYPGEEMADPLGREQAFFEKSAGEIVEITTKLAGRLFGTDNIEDPRQDMVAGNEPVEDAAHRIWGTAKDRSN